MKKGYIKTIAALLLISIIIIPVDVLAVEGNMGFSAGISVEEPIEKNEYYYTEMCFLTGVPIKLTGTLNIKKTDKNDVVYVEVATSFSSKKLIKMM